MDFLYQTFLLLSFFMCDFYRLTITRQSFFFVEFFSVVLFAFGVETFTIDFFRRIISHWNLGSQFLLYSFYFLDILLNRFLNKHFFCQTFITKQIVVFRLFGETVFARFFTVRLYVFELFGNRLHLSNFLNQNFSRHNFM